jgi:nucleoid DNA-binding protein
MTRTEFIDALADETKADKKDVKTFLDGLNAVIEREIQKGGEVPLKGLGKFKVQNRKARTGRNPITGEPVEIPAKTVVKFTVAKALKDLAPTPQASRF